MAKYSKGAQKKVESAMKRMEKGKLRSGRSGKKVTNPKQAIAIGLSEARKKGAKVPRKKSAAKKTAVKKKAAPKKRTATKTSSRKTSTAKKTAPKKKAAPKKKTARKSTAVKKASPKKKAAAPKEEIIQTNLRSASAEMESPVPPNNVQTGLLMGEDPVRAVDQKAFDKFTAKGDPRQHLRLSSKPKNAIKPSGKKPLFG
jgi:hypothetical protein